MLTIQSAPLGSGIYTAPIALAAIIMVLASVLRRRYARQIPASNAPQRQRHTEDSFVHEMASMGLDPRIARSTYRHLQRSYSLRSPILGDDHLALVLGLEGHALSRTVRTLMAENHRQLHPEWRTASIVTVRELIAFIQSSPRAEHERAA